MLFRGKKMQSQNKQSPEFRRRQELLKPLFKEMDKVLKKWIQLKISWGPNISVLDVGTGFGDMLHMLLQLPGIEKIVTIDPSTQVIQENKSAQEELFPKAQVTYRVASAEKIPFPKNTFDLVTSRITSHHFQDSRKALLEIFRVLKPNGWLILSDWTKEAPAFNEEHKAAFLSTKDAKTQLDSITTNHIVTAIAKVPQWYAFLVEKL